MASTQVSVSFGPVKKAVEKLVVEAKTKVVLDFEQFIQSKVDEETFDSLKDLFDEYKDTMSKLVVKLDDDPVSKKGKRKGGGQEPSVHVKKALSPYNIFIKNKIKELKVQFPDMKGQQLMKTATEAWSKEKHAVQMH